MGLPWFRFYHEFAGDAKVQSMEEKFQRRLVMLFCLQCDDALDKLKDEEIAFSLRISLTDLKESFLLFEDKGFISYDDEGGILLENWNKRQYKSDNSTERVRKFRDKKRNVSETPKKRRNITDKEEDKNRLTKSITEEIVDLYHINNNNLPIVRIPLSKISSRNLRARFKENPNFDWGSYFKKVQSSDFLSGRSKDWNANFHWLVRPTNFEKVVNGEYDGPAPEPVKLVKYYCQELTEDNKSLHGFIELPEGSGNKKVLLCDVCKTERVKAFEMNGLVNDKRKREEGIIKNRTRESKPTQSIKHLIKRIGV